MNNECWLWRGSHDPQGYPRININGVNTKLHRVLYEAITNKKIGKLFLCHICDNPKHMFVGNASENMKDMHNKWRHLKRKLTKKQIEEIKKSKGRYRDIGLKYGVSLTHVSNIKNGWKHAK
jgi:hypothetical protein